MDGYVAGMSGVGNSLTEELVIAASGQGSIEHQAIEHLLKGPEIAIPEPHPDKDGNPRFEARYR